MFDIILALNLNKCSKFKNKVEELKNSNGGLELVFQKISEDMSNNKIYKFTDVLKTISSLPKSLQDALVATLVEGVM